VRVTLQFGRAFAKEAGLAQLLATLDEGSTAEGLLKAVAKASPQLSCVADGRVDLSVAHLSINGIPVDPRHPEMHPLSDGDVGYLYAPISGG
jgi:hypothetical protein